MTSQVEHQYDPSAGSQRIDHPPRRQVQFATIRGFVIQDRIGRGGFSIVYRAYNHDGPGRVAACKIVSLPDPTRSQGKNKAEVDLKALQKEVQVHRSLKHKNILEFMDSLLVKPEHEQYVPGLYMLIELAMHGDLFDKIAPDVGVEADLAKLYFNQLISGIEYIHAKGICHRDLKPENLLLGANGELKISDFGLCAVWKHQGKTRLLTGRCGSLPYVAPELNMSGGYHAEPIDIWGAGVVLFTLLAGNTPWDEPSQASPEYQAYLTGELLKYDPWCNINGDALSLLLACLEVDPARRITIPQIRTHPWMMSPSQITTQMLPLELTKGLRQMGMWDVAEPTRSQIPHRGAQNDPYASQLTQMDSQFMQGTGMASTIGGTSVHYNTLSRFRLALAIEQTVQVVLDVLREVIRPKDLEEHEVNQLPVARIALLDQRKQVLMGEVKFRDDPNWPGEATLVELVRSKGDPLEWKRFWWKLVKTAGLRDLIIKSGGSQ